MIEIGEKTLSAAGIEDSKNDSRILLEYMLGIEKNKLFMIWSEEQDQKRCEQYFKYIDIRASRIPVQHITGTQNFMGFDFDVDKNVLIPRPETELLVEEVLTYCEEKNKKVDILDLCAGSGAIGISIDKMYKKATVVCSDIDEQAIKLMEKNAKKLSSKVKIKQSNLFKSFDGKLGKKKFHIIVSNPPYIPSSDIEDLEDEVKLHEPRLALDGGSTGLVFYEGILFKSNEYLKKEGMLFMEIGYNQGEQVKKIAEETGCFENIEIKKDLAGLDRIFVAKKR